MSIENDDVVKSVGRVFAVLELFDQLQEALSATEVERRLGYPQSSTMALLKSLVKLGYLSYDRIGRTYFPTLRVPMLGRWVQTSSHGLEHLDSLLDEISQRTGETVLLSCQNDLHMQFLKVKPGTNVLTLNLKPGELAPLFESVIGLTALTAKEDTEIVKTAERVNKFVRRGGKKVNIPEALELVRKIRMDGYAVGQNSHYVHSLGVVAWLLPPYQGGRAVVLSIGGPSENIIAEERSIVRAVRDALLAHSQHGAVIRKNDSDSPARA